MISFIVSSTAQTAPTLSCCTQTARQFGLISRATTCLKTASVTGLATVLSACLTAGTVRRNSSAAIRCMIRTAMCITPTGTVIQAAMYGSVCGTGWIAFPRGSSSWGFS